MCQLFNKLQKTNIKITKFESHKNSYLKTSKIHPKKYSQLFESKIINIYPNLEKQQILGFGGAITESSAYCYSLLPEKKKHDFINDYFKDNYSICRLCIGSSDFSLKSYAYANKKDLSDFNINHDLQHIIPLIKDALKINPNLKFLASPWSPPSFMKSNKNQNLGGHLLTKYKKTYAEYLSKYILAYKSHGINIDFLTVQNEPHAIQIWESCLFSGKQEADFIENYLAPVFQEKNIQTKIIIHDHNKEKLFNKACEEFSSEKTRNLISGLAFHWYSGDHYENIELIRKYYPEKLLFHTEGCFGFTKDECLYHYAQDIIDDLNAGTNAYLDWNILLDSKGGPNHKKNYCMSPIMLTSDNTDYKKSLNYYYIQHFSKFIKPNAKIIEHSKYSRNISILSAKNPSNEIVIIILNDGSASISFNICLNDISFKDTISEKSIITYLIN